MAVFLDLIKFVKMKTCKIVLLNTITLTSLEDLLHKYRAKLQDFRIITTLTFKFLILFSHQVDRSLLNKTNNLEIRFYFSLLIKVNKDLKSKKLNLKEESQNSLEEKLKWSLKNND